MSQPLVFLMVKLFCTTLAQKSQSQREDQDLASQIVVAKGERGILTEQLALKLLRSFRGLYRGEQLRIGMDRPGGGASPPVPPLGGGSQLD